MEKMATFRIICLCAWFGAGEPGVLLKMHMYTDSIYFSTVNCLFEMKSILVILVASVLSA